MVAYSSIIILIGILYIGSSFTQEFNRREHKAACGAHSIVNQGDVFFFSENPSEVLEKHSSEIDHHYQPPSHPSYPSYPSSRTDFEKYLNSYPHKDFKSERLQHDDIFGSGTVAPWHSSMDRSIRAYPPSAMSDSDLFKTEYPEPMPEHHMSERFDPNSLNFLGLDHPFDKMNHNSHRIQHPTGSQSSVSTDFGLRYSVDSPTKMYEKSLNKENAIIHHRRATTENPNKDATGDSIPRLFSEYLRSESDTRPRFGDDMFGGRSKHIKAKGAQQKDANIFELMNRVEPDMDKIRHRRSIRERFAQKRLALKQALVHKNQNKDEHSCTWKYSAGQGCNNLIVHMVSGDTSKMSCDQEFLKFSGQREERYCGEVRVRKTAPQGKQLSIEHFKKSSIPGQKFKGYVVCGKNKILH